MHSASRPPPTRRRTDDPHVRTRARGPACGAGRSGGGRTAGRHPPARSCRQGRGRGQPEHATADELESLPGIGKSTAQRILEYRQKSGGFKKIEELMNVKGIGEKSFLKIKNRLTVAAPKS
jgi:competence ComEA-like helix-hairpin-helix protein